ncbi:hypothetical protein GQ55_5G172600 [Panicum hallii var. hallii]|uniref:Uncharacterized protein n=1 Tax=Panicum hallii var. hallii TaxID=1504633 RepID=A0A2T7DH77_9POAL|nr:hypothetical protein GQ55_5G172600 [Panicum hallii var. hallii]
MRRETRGGGAAPRCVAHGSGRSRGGRGGGGERFDSGSGAQGRKRPPATRGRGRRPWRAEMRAPVRLAWLPRWGPDGESIDLSFCGVRCDGAVTFSLRATVTGGGTFQLRWGQFRRGARIVLM